jgi:hypothetical protein
VEGGGADALRIGPEPGRKSADGDQASVWIDTESDQMAGE